MKYVFFKSIAFLSSLITLVLIVGSSSTIFFILFVPFIFVGEIFPRSKIELKNKNFNLSFFLVQGNLVTQSLILIATVFILIKLYLNTINTNFLLFNALVSLLIIPTLMKSYSEFKQYVNIKRAGLFSSYSS